jgi:hypothetical protein
MLTARFIALPTITLAQSEVADQLEVAWPDAPNWVLQESTDLVTWTTSPRAITTLDGKRSVSVDTNAGQVYFRLKFQ